MKRKKINIAVIGATGYVGLDLLYLLSKHPMANIKYLCAKKNIGKSIKSFDSRIKKNTFHFLSYYILKIECLWHFLQKCEFLF